MSEPAQEPSTDVIAGKLSSLRGVMDEVHQYLIGEITTARNALAAEVTAHAATKTTLANTVAAHEITKGALTEAVNSTEAFSKQLEDILEPLSKVMGPMEQSIDKARSLLGLPSNKPAVVPPAVAHPPA